MAKKELEIKGNVMNQYKLLRNTAFKDPLCLLDEDVQNAQRSGAKNVHITFDSYNKKLVIQNDGEVLESHEKNGDALENHQILFTMGESGWKKEVMESETPFGMGFFSNIPASDFIEIYSGNVKTVFEEKEKIAIYSEYTEEYLDGFKLVLNNFKLDGINSWDIEERVKLLGNHIYNMDIYYNEKLIPKKSLTEGEGLPFEMSIEDDELFQGWIALTENGYWQENRIKVFYKGRFVTKLDEYEFYCLKGNIHVNDKALTLQSPDRKDIVDDTKFKSFKAYLKTYAAKLAEMSVLSGNERDVKKYEQAIERYVDVDSIRTRLPLSVFDGKTDNDMNYLSDIALAITKDENIKTIGEYEVYLRKQEEEKQETELSFSVDLEENKEESSDTMEEEEKEERYYSSYTPTSYTYDSDSHDEDEDDDNDEQEVTEETNRSIGQKIYLEEETKDAIFWVKLDEIGKFSKRIQLIKTYGIKLIIAQNKIETNVLERSQNSKIYHIGNLEEKIIIKSYITNTELSPKEKRAEMLLDMISRMFGFEENVFQIGNVMVTKYIEVPKLGLQYEEIAPDINVVANKEEKVIFVDRTLIENTMLSGHEKTELEVGDFKFILRNLKQLVKEISLLGVKEKENVMEEILYTLSIVA